MLDWIDIKDFAIAKHVELDFDAGLSVITGETGAGKSIFINALSVVLGNRADSAMVRHGQTKAEIQARFSLPEGHKAIEWLNQQELLDDDQCILRRVLHTDKSSKAFVNGRAVSASQMKQLGSMLVDIHGQHEHQSLLKPQAQQELLDQYGNCTQTAAELRGEYKALNQAQEELADITRQETDLRDRLELVNFQLQELQSFAPEENEWPALESDHKCLHHLAQVQHAGRAAKGLLSGNNAEESSATDKVANARHQLDSIVDYVPELKDVISTLAETEILLNDSVSNLDRLLNNSELDEQTLAAVEARFSEFHVLARKYQTSPEKLSDTLTKLQETQRALSNPEAEKTLLIAKIQAHTEKYHKIAKRLTSQREKAAEKLSKSVTNSMQHLGLKGGSFHIKLVLVASENGSAHGNESVSFEVVTNPGFPAQSLARVASGGELSRISLAIQVLLAENKTSSSMVFDEVDVGVGGQTAAIVGKLLSELAAHSQILCITHLAQVAAHGHAHYKVQKNNDDETNTQIQALDQNDRVVEIARMVGGEQLTDESMAHAKSLLKQA